MSEEDNVKTEEGADVSALVPVTVTAAVSAITVVTTSTLEVQATSNSTSCVTANTTVTTTTTAASCPSATTAVPPTSSDPPTLEHVRIKLSDKLLETISRDELVRMWRAQDSFIDMLETQMATNEERYWKGRRRKRT